MKKWLVILVCLLMVSCAPRVTIKSDYDFSKIKRVAVLPFEPLGSQYSTFYADWFTTELIKTRKFEVVERAQLDKVLTEQLLEESGVIDRATLTKIGEILGVNAVFLGSCISHQVRGYIKSYANVRLVDIETGVVLWSGTSSDMPKLTRELIKQLK